MPRPLLIFLILLGSTAGVSGHAQAFHVGEATRAIHPKEPRDWRGAKTQALIARIWYPVDPSIPEKSHDIGPTNHPIFQGHPLAVNAPLSKAKVRYPFILISHGSGGSADTLDWLATQLAAHGFIAVGVDHPGNNAFEPYTVEGFSLWWERARDMSDALDAMLKDRQFDNHIDQRRIGAAGFSLGGYTVLELAGARTNRDALLHFCNSKAADALCHPPEMPDIVKLQDSAAMQTQESKTSIVHAGDSYRDRRVRAVFAIAPGLGEAFTRNGLKDITIPVQIVDGASDRTAPLDTNAKRFAQLQPAFQLKLLPGGVAHYTFLDTCVSQLNETALSICKDAPGVNRDQVHAEVGTEAVEFFDRYLNSSK